MPEVGRSSAILTDVDEESSGAALRHVADGIVEELIPPAPEQAAHAGEVDERDGRGIGRVARKQQASERRALDEHLAFRGGRRAWRRTDGHGPLGVARTITNAFHGHRTARAVGAGDLDLGPRFDSRRLRAIGGRAPRRHRVPCPRRGFRRLAGGSLTRLSPGYGSFSGSRS